MIQFLLVRIFIAYQNVAKGQGKGVGEDLYKLKVKKKKRKIGNGTDVKLLRRHNLFLLLTKREGKRK